MTGNAPVVSKPAIKHEATIQERQAAARFGERLKAKSPAPSYSVEQTSPGNVTLTAIYLDRNCATILLLDTCATASSAFADGLLDQLSNATRSGAVLRASDINFALAVLKGIGPRDETEALLATQMAAIHTATMRAARNLNHIDTNTQQDSSSNVLNKLARAHLPLKLKR
jgi:hypothetical protein